MSVFGVCGDARWLGQDEKKVVTAVLSRLKEPQVAGLVAAVETRGAEPGPCCPVPALPRPGPAPIHALMCRLYRGWGPDTREAWELVRLPSCDCDTSDDIYTCCNPYHWSRLLQPGGQLARRDVQLYASNIVFGCRRKQN